MARKLMTWVTFGCLAAVASAQERIQSHYGASWTDHFGVSIAGLDDIDFDGIDDWAVGINWEDNAGTNAGAVEIRSGADGSLLLGPIDGQAATGEFGFSLAAVPDVDGDGLRDLIVGAPWYNNGNLANAGMAMVISSFSGRVLRSFLGSVTDGEFAFDVNTAGDVDGDGVADFFVGARGAGSAFVYSGADGSSIHEFDGPWRFGFRVEPIGDVDGDSTGDLLVGEPNGAGKVHLFSGASGVLLRAWSGSGGDELGYSVLAVPDADGDGRMDVLAGSPYSAPNGVDSGKATLFSSVSGLALKVFTGHRAYERLGSSLSLTDFNADGRPDFVVGAFTDNSVAEGLGSARVFSGATHWQLTKLEGESEDDLFGHTSAGIGDLNGDGFADVLVGDWANDKVNTDAGAVFAFSGDDLFLHAEPSHIVPGTDLTLSVGDGPFRSPFMVFVLEWNSTPVNQPLFFGTFRPTGGWSADFDTTGFPTGQEISLIAFALVNGELRASEILTIRS